jgi:hypothetical protein
MTRVRLHIVTVYPKTRDTGRALAFPLDMLRYDRLAPYTESDSGKIEASVREYRAPQAPGIQLLHVGRPDSWHGPTEGRWESFGWQVVAVEDR